MGGMRRTLAITIDSQKSRSHSAQLIVHTRFHSPAAFGLFWGRLSAPALLSAQGFGRRVRRVARLEANPSSPTSTQTRAPAPRRPSSSAPPCCGGTSAGPQARGCGRDGRGWRRRERAVKETGTARTSAESKGGGEEWGKGGRTNWATATISRIASSGDRGRESLLCVSRKD